MNKIPKDNLRTKSIMKIRYVGLREWMLKNRVSVGKMNELCGRSNICATINDNHDPRKSTIDAILRATGLTYEECFREEPN